MKANRNITRIERQTTGGYLVRIMRRGKLHSAFFSFNEYGGKRKALLAAREHRDALEQKLRGISRKKRAQTLRANNTSGVPGVRLVKETDPRWKSRPTYHCWVAQWSPSKGVRKTKRFSVEKYGNEEAYRLAVRARKRGVAEMGKE
ncbi:AP2/ERF family transcription factor [Roseimaritima ulvae]|uniref:AP2 domain protein n=1 Tax=Roseimaritima ulvae TaxID=980254 RepID=A0A5B9R8F2_9BACT|nr:AP2/ERF family transcription factor [Roseimaritima ulvae]QEG43061.1 AP2 domain protein [Roseimaritima ulvae]